jgi:hypothetical protein
MLSPEELLKVANAYARATGLSLITVGRAACNNDKIFIRIGEGGGALSRSIEQATGWFETNWPGNAHWPKDVPGHPQPPASGPPARRTPRTTTTA